MKLILSDALGNEVTIEPDGVTSFTQAENAAKRLFDHIRSAAPPLGPGGAGQTVGFRWTDPRYADLRDGGHLEVKA